MSAAKPPSLKSLAERINEYLRRFEADKKINARDPDIGGLQPYYNAGARYYGGSKLRVIYVSFQCGSMLTRDEAMRYLAKLDAGFVGRHHEALR